jgi:hypothetical protein
MIHLSVILIFYITTFTIHINILNVLCGRPSALSALNCLAVKLVAKVFLDWCAGGTSKPIK